MLSNMVYSYKAEVVSQDDSGKVIHEVITFGDTQYEGYKVLKTGVVEVEYSD